MVDSSTAGDARRPRFISRATRPRLVEHRPRVDRPSSASSGWTAFGKSRTALLALDSAFVDQLADRVVARAVILADGVYSPFTNRGESTYATI